MDGMKGLLSATSLSRRRAMKLRAPRSGDMLLYAWLVIVIFIRFAENCALAFRELSRGSRPVGLAITEFTMLHFLVVVFLLTFLSSSLSLGAASLNRRRLSLAAVPRWPLLAAELAGLSTNPMSWVVFLFVIPAAAPLLALPHPVPAIIALLASFVAAVLSASALGQALALSPSARRFAGAFRYLFVGAMIGFLLANFDFQWTGRSIQLFVFQKPTLLDDGAGRGILPFLNVWSPSAWVPRGWILPCIALVAAALLLYAAALRAVYAASGELVSAAQPRRPPFRRSPSRSPSRASFAGRSDQGLLVRHELRHLAASPGSLAGLAAAVGFSAWLLASRRPTVLIAILGSFAILLTGFSFISNIFGRDGRALRRYALLSPDWARIFSAKSSAWLAVTGASLAPLVVALAVRGSLFQALSLSLTGAAVMMLCVLWGSISSILLPSERQHRGSAPPQNVAFVNQAAPFALCGIPLALHARVAPFGSTLYDLAVAGCLAAGLALYAILLHRICRTFDAELESVLARF